MKYSNPRMRAEIRNWPSGSKRVMAVFEIEQNSKGERACRTTTGATKKSGYAQKARIVDGDDGRTYIAELHPEPYDGLINIVEGTMKFSKERIRKKDERFQELRKLFE